MFLSLVFKFIEELSDTYAVFIMNSVNGRELTQYGIRKYILPFICTLLQLNAVGLAIIILYLYHGSDLFSIVTSLLAYLHNGSKVGIVKGQQLDNRQTLPLKKLTKSLGCTKKYTYMHYLAYY